MKQLFTVLIILFGKRRRKLKAASIGPGGWTAGPGRKWSYYIQSSKMQCCRKLS